MSVPGMSSRFLYYFDSTASLGVNLSGTPGQVGEFDPASIEVGLQELSGSFATYPTVAPVGYETAGDIKIPIYANSTLQELIDDIHGTTASDRQNNRIICYGWTGGDVVGQKFEGLQGYEMKVAPKTPMAKLTEIELNVKPNGMVSLGLILHALGAETADGDSSAASIDNGAATALGGVGFFGYTTYTAGGASGLAVRILDSADNITFGALITFTTITATTGGGQRSALGATAAVKRYIDCDWDFTGSPGGSTTCTFFVGFARGA